MSVTSTANTLLNPTNSETKHSDLDLVVAGTANVAVLMVESEAKILSGNHAGCRGLFGHEQMQTAIQAINELPPKSAQAHGIGGSGCQHSAQGPRLPTGHCRTGRSLPHHRKKAVRYETIAELKQKVV